MASSSATSPKTEKETPGIDKQKRCRLRMKFVYGFLTLIGVLIVLSLRLMKSHPSKEHANQIKRPLFPSLTKTLEIENHPTRNVGTLVDKRQPYPEKDVHALAATKSTQRHLGPYRRRLANRQKSRLRGLSSAKTQVKDAWPEPTRQLMNRRRNRKQKNKKNNVPSALLVGGAVGGGIVAGGIAGGIIGGILAPALSPPTSPPPTTQAPQMAPIIMTPNGVSTTALTSFDISVQTLRTMNERTPSKAEIDGIMVQLTLFYSDVLKNSLAGFEDLKTTVLETTTETRGSFILTDICYGVNVLFAFGVDLPSSTTIDNLLEGADTAVFINDYIPNAEPPDTIFKRTVNVETRPKGQPSAQPTGPGEPSEQPSEQPGGPPTGPGDTYDITLDLLNVDDDTEFSAAAIKWASVITSGLPDFDAAVDDPLIGFNDENPCDAEGDWPDFIDDLYICCQYQTIPEPLVLGFASFILLRPDTLLPATGIMVFDNQKIEDFGVDLAATINHEIGHVVGIGSLWERLDLAPRFIPCEYKENTKASQEYQALSGCTGPIPLEQSFGSTGSDCVHWEETCFGNEIMTPAIDNTNPFSRITIAGLQDLGYEVNYDVADPFTTLDPSCVCAEDQITEFKKNRYKKSRKGHSEQGREAAISFGKQVLASRSDAPQSDSKRIYGVVSVVYYEDGVVYSVMVFADD